MIFNTLAFDEGNYLEANPDVAEAVSNKQIESGLKHWNEWGRKENRPLDVLGARKYKVFHSLKKNGSGLEIGPSHNPIAPKKEGYDVQVIDHADQETLRKKYASHGLNLENIEKVDFVWQGQSLPILIGKTECYDWIIASHVIEHVPDLISFLQQCEALLKPDGILSLVIPDKRYCFDYFDPLTSTGELLDAFEQKRTRPSLGKIFDHFANASARKNCIAWSKDNQDQLSLIHSFEIAKDQWHAAQNSPDYVDVHCWRFTPTSFEIIAQDLRQLGLLNLQYKNSFDTNGSEFYVSLEKSTEKNSASQKSRIELSQAMHKELSQ
jgi:2-polyprenyl-3-methyl-5-hydroxy-6-metoxy-1,4-benzoquinol methylase